MTANNKNYKNYKLAIFDFDGTLADTYPAFVQALMAVVQSQRLRAIDPIELETYRSGHGRVLMQRLGVRWWQLPRVAAAMLQAMTQVRDQMRLFAGVDHALEQLAQAGVVIAIVSSNSEDNVRAVLGPWARVVHVYECGAALFGKKARFQRVMRCTGIAPHQTIAIGDELRDQDAARAAGIAFGAVAWGYTAPQALRDARPDVLIDSPLQLQALLLSAT